MRIKILKLADGLSPNLDFLYFTIILVRLTFEFRCVKQFFYLNTVLDLCGIGLLGELRRVVVSDHLDHHHGLAPQVLLRVALRRLQTRGILSFKNHRKTARYNLIPREFLDVIQTRKV
jgi:hypothetical protein